MSDKYDPDAPGAQPMPVPNGGPGMHDLVIQDILSRDPRWDLSVGTARHIRDRVAEDLLERKEFGLRKYKTMLQIGNGRDFLADLYDELQDATVYARGRLLELDESTLEYLVLFEIYEDLVRHLTVVRRIRNLYESATE